MSEDAAARLVDDEIAQGSVLGDERDCSQQGFAWRGPTPPTIIPPTSPSVWQVTTWLILELRIASRRARLR
jgi:hypothetical protein